MIWNFIRDFIVENITGGVTSTGVRYACSIGYANYWLDGVNEDGEPLTGDLLNYVVNSTPDNYQITLSFSDWLATTLTTICMCLIVAFAIWLIIWVFKAVAHAFLLRR